MTSRRGVALTPMEVRRDVIVRAARLADDLGYEVFSMAEGWGLDATVVLAEIAVRTYYESQHKPIYIIGELQQPEGREREPAGRMS